MCKWFEMHVMQLVICQDFYILFYFIIKAQMLLGGIIISSGTKILLVRGKGWSNACEEHSKFENIIAVFKT